MKLVIIGPSCVGKTTMAKRFSRLSGLTHFDLDLVMIDGEYLAETKLFRYRKRVEYEKRVETILKNNKEWIIEGIYAINRVLEEADKIIFIKLPIYFALYWQWKRFFCDKCQRDTYGFLNNLELSREIFGQYLLRVDKKNIDNPTINGIKKDCLLLNKHKSKLVVITNINELDKMREIGKIESI
jgi:adenylate kinase family enzyme